MPTPIRHKKMRKTLIPIARPIPVVAPFPSDWYLFQTFKR
jgi:hypothetical protein